MSTIIERHCSKCNRTYLCEIVEQVPGFRDTEEEICPYCGEVVRTSLEYEFHTTKIEDLKYEAYETR